MTASDLAVVITAVASALAALGSLVVAAVTLIQVIRVHTMVNQQRTDMMRLLELQRSALQAAGITIPLDESLNP